MEQVKKIKLLKGERASIMPIKKTAKGNRYAITNFGRVISFTTKVELGQVLATSNLGGYRCITLPIKGEQKNGMVHRLVAIAFLRKPGLKQNKVIHLNYKKDDNHYKNLKWATIKEQVEHTLANPNYHSQGGNVKLTEAQVRQIKIALQKGKSTLKSLAQKFKVSDMQIHRIRTGENWSRLKI